MSRQICSWGALAWLPAQAAQSFHPTPPASPPRFAAQPCPALLWRCDLSYTAWPAPPSQHRAAQQPREPCLAAKPALPPLPLPAPPRSDSPHLFTPQPASPPSFKLPLHCCAPSCPATPHPARSCLALFLPYPAPLPSCLLCLAQPCVPARSCPFHPPHSLGFRFL